jgi:spore coat protein U-like protein
MSRCVVGALATALLLCAGRVRAATCGFNSVVPVTFGSYDTITISLSTGSSGNYGARTMLFGANTLNYNLYMDAARTTVWGDHTSGTSNYGPVFLAILPITLQIYGRIPARQNAKAGSYTDTVVVTMLF